MVRTLPYGPETGLNPARIAGISVAILVHVAAFLLLLIPATLPPLVQHLDVPKPQFEIIEKPKPKPIEVPIDTSKLIQPPPLVRRQEKPQAPVAPPTPITIDTPSSMPAIAEAVVPSELGPVTDNASITAPTGPISASHLAYVRAPAPAYPRSAIMAHAEGTVILRVLVDVDGTPLEVVIETSSGNRELDRVARTQVLKSWKFQPAMQDGRAVQAYGRVPVDFSLR
ncbi:energy transducer TonB [Pseudoxanthomonas sp.]|uniref:energy transducer TonB n=1 Tax=Pseudoxanthomonas sp. TaxID=1871049 RepID=UPI002611E2FA|nr:energy transducer TonB [Pseudoxanthomonas sp.]WDS37346.1 MAG: TonB family protein [Pseudoxanthomonas sp.]